MAPSRKIQFPQISACVGHHANEHADHLAKETARDNTLGVCYDKIPKRKFPVMLGNKAMNNEGHNGSQQPNENYRNHTSFTR